MSGSKGREEAGCSEGGCARVSEVRGTVCVCVCRLQRQTVCRQEEVTLGSATRRCATREPQRPGDDVQRRDGGYGKAPGGV